MLSTHNVSAGAGIAVTETGTRTVISLSPAAQPKCIPKASALTWTITAAEHGLASDGFGVVLYDDQSPRNALLAGWTVDPTTLTVVVTFAVPQAGCVVVR